MGDIAPVAGDKIIFNATSSKNALVDAAFVGTIASIDITSAYTGTLGLGRDLTVTSSFIQAGATLSGGNRLTIDTGATANWNGGTMLGLGTTRIESGAIMRVGTTAAKYLNGWRLENTGTISWGDTGNLYAFAATVSNTGTFEVTASASFHDSYLGLSSFINDGTFRTLGAVEVPVSIPFTNNEKVETFAGRLTFSNIVQRGTIDTGGILNLTGRFVWQSGAIDDTHAAGSGTVVLGPTAQGELSTVSDKILSVSMLNEGQVTWTDGDFNLSQSRAVFTNAGAFSIVGALSLRGPGAGSGSFHNLPAGLVVKAGDAGTVATITSLSFLKNDGTIECVSGTLSIQSPGEHTGDFDVAANCTIEFDGGGAPMTTVVKDPEGGGFPPGLLGSGWYRVKAMMTLEIEAYILTPQKFELAAEGVLAGSGKLRAMKFEWLANSTVTKNVEVEVPSNGELHITGAGNRTFNGGKIVNYGRVTWDDGSIKVSKGVSITVDGSAGAGKGIFDIKGDGTIEEAPLDPAGLFTIKNNGILQKSAGTGVTDIQMGVETKSGGKVDAMGRNLKTKSQTNVSGIIELNGGTLSVAEAFQQHGGSTALGGGLLNLLVAVWKDFTLIYDDNETLLYPVLVSVSSA